MKKIKSKLKSVLLRGAMLLVGMAWAIAQWGRIVWKGYNHKSKHH